MDKQPTLLLSQVLKDFVRKQGLSGELLRMEIFSAWDDVAGLNIAKATTNKFFKDGILYCTINSSVIRNSTYYQLDGILRRLNELLPDAKVKKIILK